jgi:hypothetical protein
MSVQPDYDAQAVALRAQLRALGVQVTGPCGNPAAPATAGLVALLEAALVRAQREREPG